MIVEPFRDYHRRQRAPPSRRSGAGRFGASAVFVPELKDEVV